MSEEDNLSREKYEEQIKNLSKRLNEVSGQVHDCQMELKTQQVGLNDVKKVQDKLIEVQGRSMEIQDRFISVFNEAQKTNLRFVRTEIAFKIAMTAMVGLLIIEALIKR
ncbi:MAG: hypothetical protein ACFN1I_00905 [Selenomonas artemidis]